MYNHAPKNYECPICIGLKGEENDKTLIRNSDFVYKDELVSAFVNSFFIQNNKGHVIIVPNLHFENLYDLPDDIAHRVLQVSKLIAVTIKKAYGCDGIFIQQNNEPASDQHAFHYHMHVIPRYENDEIFKHIHIKLSPTQEERKKYADRLKEIINLEKIT